MEKKQSNKLEKQAKILDFFTKKPIENEIGSSKNKVNNNNNIQKLENPEKKDNMETSLYEIKDESGIIYEYRQENGTTKLKNKKTNGGFIFNKNEYNKIGDYVINYVDERIMKFKMEKLWVPSDNKEKALCDFKKPKNFPQCHIFVSKNFEEENKKLLVLIQGTGAVRAGIWSRSVCINDSLEKGSVIPFLEFAQKNDYQVIILNPNERNSTNQNLKGIKRIDDFSSMERHCVWVWKEIIVKYSKATEVHIVAHSMGGVCTVEILRNAIQNHSIDRIKKIAFTDAVHGQSLRNLIIKKSISYELQMNMVHFVAHKEKAGFFIDDPRFTYDGIVHCSAGHTKHEFTTGFAFEEIVKFFESKNVIEYIEGNKNVENPKNKSNSIENHENSEEKLFAEVQHEVEEISINNEAVKIGEIKNPIENSKTEVVNPDDIIVEFGNLDENKMEIELNNWITN